MLLGTAAALCAASAAWFLAAPAAAAERVDAMRFSGSELTDHADKGAGHLRVRCESCGVVESTRQVAGSAIVVAKYETTVRLRDGTKRVFEDSGPSNWRPGEAMVFIEGARSPVR